MEPHFDLVNRFSLAHQEPMKTDEHQTAERLRRQQDLLAEFGSKALYSRDLDDLLNRASELVAQGLDIKRAKVLELLPDGKELLLRAGVNWNPGVVGEVRFGAGMESPAGFALHCVGSDRARHQEHDECDHRGAGDPLRRARSRCHTKA